MTLVLLAACGSESTSGDDSAQAGQTSVGPAAGETGSSTQQAFDASFERAYADGWKAPPRGARPDARFSRSAAVRREVVQAFLREYQPLEQATRSDVHALVESGQALQYFDQAISTLGLDPENLVDVVAVHHAVHWAVVNADRVREEQLPAIREAVGSSALLAELAGTDDAGKQTLADRAAILTAIRSNEYARLLQAGDRRALQNYGDLVAAEFMSRHGVDLREGRVEPMPPAEGRALPRAR